MNKKEIIKKLKNVQKEIEIIIDEFSKVGSSSVATSSIPKKSDSEGTGQDIILKIANKIKDCNEADQIEKEVLDKSSQDNRIIMCHYIVYKYFSNQWLKTSDVEKITKELGVKIKHQNVAKVIRERLSKYLESDSIRKEGGTVFYRLNRKGIKYFENLLHGQKNR